MIIETENYKTKELGTIVSMDPSLEVSATDLARIADVCNQPLVYDFLFKQRLAGRAYGIEDAKSFVDWAKTGWQGGSFYVFLIKDRLGNISGCMDIKAYGAQDEATEREVGYWASSDKPGFMTEAVKKLPQIAKELGFKKLYGFVRLDNDKSSSVLIRSGFEPVGTVKRNEKEYKKFEINVE